MAQVTVTQFAQQICQPPYLKDNPFGEPERQFVDAHDTEYLAPTNFNPAIVGSVVDYLSRYLALPNKSAEKCFEISLLGWNMIIEHYPDNIQTHAQLVEINQVIGDFFDQQHFVKQRVLTDELVTTVVKLACLDVAYRRGNCDLAIKQFQELPAQLDDATLQQIKQLTNRCVKLLNLVQQRNEHVYPTFEVHSPKSHIFGDGDIIADHVILDFKVYKSDPWTAQNAVQLALYYLIGKWGKSNVELDFNGIQTLMLFDVRRNQMLFTRVNQQRPALTKIDNFMRSVLS